MNKKDSGHCAAIWYAAIRVEMLVNLINISYCAMKLLPYQDETFYK